MRTLRLVLACAAVLAAGACDKDTLPPGGTSNWIVNVRNAETGMPVRGVKVVPMDRATNAPLAVPLVSGADGVCDFGQLHAWPAVLAFAPEGYRIFGAPLQERVDLFVGPDVASPTALTPPAPEAPPWLVRVVFSPPPAGSRISGRVVDGDSGRALVGAFISASPYPTGYDGTNALDDVTAADGTFSIKGVHFVDLGGSIMQAAPLFVTCAGYGAITWVYPARPGEDLGNITGVEIALHRETGDFTGSLRGRVLRRGAPVDHLWVGLGAANLLDKDMAARLDKGGAGQPGLTALTDAAGVFVFTDIPAGTYVIHPGFLPEDGAWFPDQPANVLRSVHPDSTTDAGDYQVVWEMEAESPRNGAVEDRSLRTFDWSPVAGASTYGVTIDRAAPVFVTGSSLTLAPGDTLASGAHVWQVAAFADAAADTIIGTFGAQAEFWVTE